MNGVTEAEGQVGGAEERRVLVHAPQRKQRTKLVQRGACRLVSRFDTAQEIFVRHSLTVRARYPVTARA